MEFIFTYIIPTVLVVVVIRFLAMRLVVSDLSEHRRKILFRGLVLLSIGIILISGIPLIESWIDAASHGTREWESSVAQVTARCSLFLSYVAYMLTACISTVVAVGMFIATSLLSSDEAVERFHLRFFYRS